jgi:hypothetical protein
MACSLLAHNIAFSGRCPYAYSCSISIYDPDATGKISSYSILTQEQGKGRRGKILSKEEDSMSSLKVSIV